jgi:hypothetical protein
MMAWPEWSLSIFAMYSSFINYDPIQPSHDSRCHMFAFARASIMTSQQTFVHHPISRVRSTHACTVTASIWH